MTTTTQTPTSIPIRQDWLPELLPITIRLPDEVVAAGSDACEDWFWAVNNANPDFPWALELNADGALELMPPTYPPSDEHEGESYFELQLWNRNQGRPGTATGPTGAYRLPNGAIRSPDAAWTLRERVLPQPVEPPRARPYCPDFVLEIRSTSQVSVTPLLAKMQEYMESGARLGWFIDPIARTVRIYRAGVAEPELLQDPETLDGEDVLSGFIFPVRELIFNLVAIPDTAE